MEPFSMIFLDPPYGKGLAEQALISAHDGGWLTSDALIVVEEASESEFAAPREFEEIKRRDYGGTQLVFLRVSSPSS
jgi:16S rRNA (guanine966-N2)-methyltransferase